MDWQFSIKKALIDDLKNPFSVFKKILIGNFLRILIGNVLSTSIANFQGKNN